MQSWVVSRYQECRTVLQDHDLFARDRRRVGIDVPEFMQNLQSLDPPALVPLKKVTVAAFRRQNMEHVAAAARRDMLDIFATMADRAEFDWIHEVAAPVALTVTAELFGVERPDPESYYAISDAIARRMDGGLCPERIEPGNQARIQLNLLTDKWYFEDRRPGLFNDLRDSASQAKVPEHYVRNTVGVMFNASFGTLFATIGNVALTILQHPWVLDRLRDESLLDTGVDELIRFDGPAQGTSRLATRHTTLGGMPVEPGQIVMTLIASANRDPQEFPNPDEIVLDRKPNRHLAFGFGSHACLGTLFGRLAVKEVVRCLNAVARLRLAGAPVRRTTATVRSMDRLPVSFR